MKIKRQDTSIPVFSYVMDIFLFSHPLQLLITQHSLVQFFLHPVNEIGAAFVLPAFDISVEAVAVFRINPEYLITRVRDNTRPNGWSANGHRLSGDPTGRLIV